jgi:hypothetical protein
MCCSATSSSSSALLAAAILLGLSAVAEAQGKVVASVVSMLAVYNFGNTGSCQITKVEQHLTRSVLGRAAVQT